MVSNGHRRANERVRIETLGVRERHEHLAEHLAVGLGQDANTSDAGRVAAAFNWTGFHKWQPLGNCIKAPDDGPDFFRRCLHNAAHKNPWHWTIAMQPRAMWL